MNDIRNTLQQSIDALEQYLDLWNGNSKFIVILQGGIPIRCQGARKTFEQVIKTLQAENMDDLCKSERDSPLISNQSADNREEIAPGRYIKRALNNEDKAEYLLLIAERLDVELFIIDITTNNTLIAAWNTSDGKKFHTIPQQPDLQ